MATSFIKPEDCNLADFTKICSQSLSKDQVPNAVSIEKNIPLYDASTLTFDESLLGEWAEVLRN